MGALPPNRLSDYPYPARLEVETSVSVAGTDSYSEPAPRCLLSVFSPPSLVDNCGSFFDFSDYLVSRVDRARLKSIFFISHSRKNQVSVLRKEKIFGFNEEEARKLEGKIYGNNENFGCFTSTKKYALKDVKDKDYIKEIDGILGRKKIFARKGTGTIMACYFPISIIIIWTFIGTILSPSFLLISIIFLFTIFIFYLLYTK